MYDEVENATCMWPIAWFHVYTRPYYVFLPMCGTQRSAIFNG